MIVVQWARGVVAIDGGISAMPPDTQGAVERVLSRPARVQRSAELPEGGIEDQLVLVDPGEPGHARAALLTLPDARVVVED